MATKKELIKGIEDMQSGLNDVDAAFRPKLEEKIEDFKKQLAQIEAEEFQQMPTATQTLPAPAAPTQASSNDEYGVQQIVQMMQTLMGEQVGGGADSVEVRNLIKTYLENDKVQLNELDQRVIDFIKQNQKVTLELPAFGMNIEMSKADSKIPNIYAIIDDVLAGNNVYLIGEAGGGKAGSLNSKILTENGWTTYRDIKVGDKVWGEDGKLYDVTGVFDRGVKDVYGVTFNDGGYTETCDEHLWKIYTRNDRHRRKKGRVLPLSDLINNIRTKKGNANAYIDVAKPIPFKEQKHIVDPYLMGVIIGDGNLTQLPVSITKPQQELFDYLPIPNGIKLSKINSQNNCLTYSLVKDEDSDVNVVTEEFRRFGMEGKNSINKFIPKEYLIDSIENRIALLQGLNDTDSYCDNSHFEYSTSSERLANDYVELVRSLGGTAKATTKIPCYIHNGEKRIGALHYRISCVFPDEIMPYRLSYKKEKYSPNTKYKVKRFMSSIEFKGKEPVRCISVSNPTRLYITDDYIVTHNTYTAETVAQLLERAAIVINCSQYTAPTEIIGGQTIEGFKEGKLIKAWRDGDILILDEMPKLDPNTAGLFNDALAKSSKTRPINKSKISSANPEDPQFERNAKFACIATGNIYPNSPDTRRYVGNNQQDLSLLDRFSGSVYFVEFSDYQDQVSCRYNFLYEMLVGNYHTYMAAKRAGTTLPQAIGLRTIMESLDMKNYALVSYRTLISFRVAFEYELVRAIAKSEGKTVTDEGKSVLKCFDSYLVAFPRDAKNTLVNTSKFTESYIKLKVKEAIDTVIKSKDKMTGYIEVLAPDVKANAAQAFAQAKEWSISEVAVK